MSTSDALLPEYDQEMKVTRRLLERVPEDRLGFKPHEKSMTLGRLATHIAELPSWGKTLLEEDSWDVAPPGAEPRRPLNTASRDEILKRFDANVKDARERISAVSDERMAEPWSLKKAGQVVLTRPRGAMVRSMLLSHMIHHRGQLSVYLRQNEVPIPSIYGPTADEPF